MYRFTFFFFFMFSVLKTQVKLHRSSLAQEKLLVVSTLPRICKENMMFNGSVDSFFFIDPNQTG